MSQRFCTFCLVAADTSSMVSKHCVRIASWWNSSHLLNCEVSDVLYFATPQTYEWSVCLPRFQHVLFSGSCIRTSRLSICLLRSLRKQEYTLQNVNDRNHITNFERRSYIDIDIIDDSLISFFVGEEKHGIVGITCKTPPQQTPQKIDRHPPTGRGRATTCGGRKGTAKTAGRWGRGMCGIAFSVDGTVELWWLT